MHAQHLALSFPRLPARLTRRRALAAYAGAATTLLLGSASWRKAGDAPASRAIPRGSDDVPYAVARVLGGPGTGDGQFRSPWHLAIGGRGELLVADSENRRIQRFSRDGEFLQAWNGAGSGNASDEAQFLDPRGIASDGQQVVYVADAAADRVWAFALDGRRLAAWGTRGQAPGQFRAPSAVAVSRGGQVYVGDTGNHRVQAFTADGVYLRQWGSLGDGLGQFLSPQGIAIGPEETVLVADTGNHRVQMFSAEGTFLRAWGSPGTGAGALGLPLGVAADTRGRILVTDSGNHRVQLFAGDGAYLGQFGGPETGPGQLAFPRGITATADGLVHVGDAGSHRLLTFAHV